MSRPAISISNIGKSYRLGQGGGGRAYATLRESVTRWARRPLARPRGPGAVDAARDETFWALKDVSFDVRPGEIVGVIGRNGAGKSTLLKILSRITKPTTGEVRLRGRVGSLLEVGTGFHPELSGRENIFLNGSILGMTRVEIAKQFDAIVAFAEVERFLDTPVKRYSSGMYVRLAFAVAAHLEPEVMVVDEVLAVGDAEFQKKCLGKMSEVSHSGRTILFVSHNMSAVRSLCTRAVHIAGGTLVDDGETASVIEGYVRRGCADGQETRDLTVHPGRAASSRRVMRRVTLKDDDGRPCASFPTCGALNVEVELDTNGERYSPVLGIVFKDQYGAPVFGNNNRVVPGFRYPPFSGRGTLTMRVPTLPLMPGTYDLDLYFGDEHVDHDTVTEAIPLTVHPDDVFGSGRLPPPTAGTVVVPATFAFEHRTADADASCPEARR